MASTDRSVLDDAIARLLADALVAELRREAVQSETPAAGETAADLDRRAVEARIDERSTARTPGTTTAGC